MMSVHKRRFRTSGHKTISALMEGHDVDILKHAGHKVCLTWALKGACHSECEGHKSQVTCPRSVNQQITELLDDWGWKTPNHPGHSPGPNTIGPMLSLTECQKQQTALCARSSTPKATLKRPSRAALPHSPLLPYLLLSRISHKKISKR